ncbi:Ankyrin repeat and SAM domain-containing protein 6 [Chionoecetes opilio]|uniref:Ankyrin repeat and SAM domain-containing protein 6 n=1 Tax=Chionoecetes opilio TaxID=41210 RepID=A0A8J5CZ27_CHIOP|nr:Ankyrin repeat and SAM domain-containing protein 6 [Chionoecetes opilio]
MLTGLFVDCPDHDNNTALHIAAANDHEALVSLLVQHQADRETPNSLGWTPLMQAARHGHMEVVVLLVQGGAAVDKHNRLGMTALMLASVSGHMGTIRALIDAGAAYDPEPSITTCQVTPLMIAAQHGNDAVVRLYLDKGVSANKATPKTGMTPLMFSAAGGSLSTAQILLGRGADPNAISACDMTALDVATICNRTDISKCLQEKTSYHKKKGALRDIMGASRRGDLKAVQEILLADPSQCQAPTADGATPLMVAAMMGHKQVAQVLVQCGAHLDARDHKNGWTALMQAIYHRQTGMARFLVQCGADIGLATHRGYTAYDFASEMLDTEMMRVFVEAQMNSLGLGSPPSAAQPARHPPDGSSKLGLKHWWNRVSNKFHRVKPQRLPACPEPDSLAELSLVAPLPPIQYDPILPQEVQLPPVMSFGANSIHVLDTLKSMVPPHISSTEGRPNLAPKAMRPGHKILPKEPVKPPRHATNSRLLRWSMGSGGPSPGSSLWEAKSLRSLLKVKSGHVLHGPEHPQRKTDNEVLVSSLGSGGSGGSSLKTVASSKSSKSSQSTSTLVAPEASAEQEPGLGGGAALTLSLGSGQLSEVLHKLSLDKYLEVFLEQEVDLDAFLELSDADLRDLGISSPSARHNILAASASLRAKLPPS